MFNLSTLARKFKFYYFRHVLWVHIKDPCPECGEMVGRRKMGRHIEKNHSNVRRFKCEVCQKGFHNSTALKEHINTHTGEKPFKCAFCTACFASRGTKAMHQRSHLGYKRKSKH